MSGLRERLEAKSFWADGEYGRAINCIHVDDALAALRQWMDENGLVCVPREATDAMVIAGEGRSDAYTKYVYARMIAAAPDPLGDGP